ncbi:MAG: alpha/beta hydrolase [Cyclobacteriaceae bacterium]
MSTWIIVVIGLVTLYVLANVILYFWQDQFLFKPEKLPADFQFKYPNLSFEEHSIELEAGVNISAIHFRIEKPKGVVFYLKGNSKSIKGWGKFAIDFTRQGFDVVMADYRGFGKSTGRRTEEGIKNDLQLVYDKIKSQVDEKFIILYGRSLGSGFAAKLASLNIPRMLVLESPFYSLTSVTKRFVPFMPMSLIMRFPIRTYLYLKYVNCPIKILHGTNDKLIPFSTSVKLSKIKPDSTRLYPVIGAGHNNMHTFEEYHRMMEEILHSKLPKAVDPEETSLNFKRKR